MSTPSPIFIGVDVGGTNIRAASFTRNSHLPQKKVKHPTKAADGAEAIIKRIENAIRDVAPPGLDGVVAIGIGTPGPLDPYQGIVFSAPNLKGWENLPLKKIMEKRLEKPVFIGNDANLAALGEWKFGGGRGHDDVLYITISTGVGGGVISQGRMLLGANGLAAEVGHVTVDPAGPMCGCGQRGHLEAIASGTAISRAARARLEAGEAPDSKIRDLVQGDLTKVSTTIIGEAAQADDPFAHQLLTEAGKVVGQALASFLHLYNPSVIVVGGGVAFVGELLFTPMREAMRQHAMNEVYWRYCPIVPAELGDDCGLIGAAALAMEEAKT